MKIKWIPRGNINQGSSRTRVFFIQRELKRRGIESGFEEISNPDIIVIQKPSVKKLEEIIKDSSQYKSKIIIDLSDHIFESKGLLKLVDYITTDTDGQSERISCPGIPIKVIPTPIDYVERNRPLKRRYNKGFIPKFVWFGYGLNLNKSVIGNLKVKITAFCDSKDYLTRNCIFQKWNYGTFVNGFSKFNISLLPVSPAPMSLEKGAIKLVTSVTLNVLPLVSDIPSYRRILESTNSEWLICKDIREWNEKTKTVSDYKIVNHYLDRLQDYVWNNYNVMRITDKWVNLFKEVL